MALEGGYCVTGPIDFLSGLLGNSPIALWGTWAVLLTAAGEVASLADHRPDVLWRRVLVIVGEAGVPASASPAIRSIGCVKKSMEYPEPNASVNWRRTTECLRGKATFHRVDGAQLPPKPLLR